MTRVKNKERILKAERERQRVIYKRITIRLLSDFSAETFRPEGGQHDLFKFLKGKNLQPRILYPARLSFKIGEIKNFSDKQ